MMPSMMRTILHQPRLPPWFGMHVPNILSDQTNINSHIVCSYHDLPRRLVGEDCSQEVAQVT